METIEFLLPSLFASYLVNSDGSGLEDEDQAKIDQFVDSNLKQYGMFYCINISEDSSFYHTNDLDNLGNDCSVFTFQIS